MIANGELGTGAGMMTQYYYQTSNGPFGVRVMGTSSYKFTMNAGSMTGTIVNVSRDVAISPSVNVSDSQLLDKFVVSSPFFDSIEINGKHYESYYSHLKDHIAKNCKEITVEEKSGENTVTAVLSNGFSGMTALEKVTLPATITEICESAFYQCASLTDITFLGTVEQWKAIKKASDWNKESGDYTVHCSDGDVEKEVITDTEEKN